MEKRCKLQFWFRWLKFWKKKPVEPSADGASPESIPEQAQASDQQTKVEDQIGPDVCNNFFADLFDDILIEDDSEILTKPELTKLGCYLPSRLLCCSWNKTFHSSRDGFSLITFYNRMKDHVTQPALLLIKDMDGNRFGTFVNEAFRISEKSFGCGETFVFSLAYGNRLQAWKWTGKNNFFIFCSAKSVCIGIDNGKFAIFLDGSLDRGRSQTCKTFDNDPLSPNGDFRVASVEVWNFE